MFTYDFSGKTIVASGAGSGMGLLLCECFVKSGGNAVLVDINEEVLNEKVDKINAEYPGRAIGLVCDVRNYEQVANVCKKAVETFGSIDVVTSLAGGSETRIFDTWQKGYKEFCDIPIEIFDWSLDVNLKGQFYFAHAAFRYMREQQSGVILGIGSIAGHEGSDYAVGYATSKSAIMNGWVKSVAFAGAKYNIRCNAIAPGPVMTRPGMANMKTLIGRAAEPQEIVDLMLYLASDMSESITGQSILIDGGRSIMFDKYHGEFGKYDKK